MKLILAAVDSLDRMPLAQATAGERAEIWEVLTLVAVFIALVVLIGMMTARRRSKSSRIESSVADPYDIARRDPPVEAEVDSDFRHGPVAERTASRK